jgi:hypothetical protein
MRVGVWSLTTKYIGVKLLVNQNKERTFKTKVTALRTTASYLQPSEPPEMSSREEFQPIVSSTDQQLQEIFASRTDHRISLVDLLRQRVDCPDDVVSADVNSFVKRGLSVQVARRSYDQQGPNEVQSPQNCPAILCCLLPCLNNTPTMKTFNNNRPDTATVTRYYEKGGTKRFLIDSVSLVVGDVITVYDGDLVPADCRIVALLNEPCEVDVTTLFGKIGQRQRPLLRSCYGEDSESGNGGGDTSGNSVLDACNVLLAGSRMVTGAALCIVTATGENSVWSTMVRIKSWPCR